VALEGRAACQRVRGRGGCALGALGPLLPQLPEGVVLPTRPPRYVYEEEIQGDTP